MEQTLVYILTLMHAIKVDRISNQHTNNFLQCFPLSKMTLTTLFWVLKNQATPHPKSPVNFKISIGLV